MGTRCLTNVFDDDGALICTMYRQYDGGPDAHGLELAKFLSKIKVINGISDDAKMGTHANGMECLAAQIVARFKDCIGGIYLVKPRKKADFEDYVYDVVPLGDRVGMRIKAPTKALFDGSAEAAVKFCEKYGE